ncbi:MAG TPA: YbhB/YbcL family Raf kinase inhibitor-like protein [Steroidobacteraceae bacterium]|nr:YbhB/YbcL family Raf kinase inhibitor-like protein [Steroidobacteraceae bacterium]
MRRTFVKGVTLLALAAMGATAMAQAPGGGPPGGGPGAGGPRGGGGPPMLVESNAFPDGGVIPLKHSMYGTNIQPDFKITGVAATAQSVAIIFHDLDVASGGNPDDNLHWMAWNIPVNGGVVTMEEGKLPDGAVGRGMRGGADYAGPGAPNTPRYHHYVFEFYALNAKLDLPPTAGRPELLEAMKGKVVGKSAYVGRFRNDTGATMQRGGGAGGPPRGPGAGGPPPPGGAGGPPRGPGPGGPAPGGF